MSRRIPLGAAGIVCAALLAVAARAGEKKTPPPYALIFGTVYASNDAPVYGATVRVRRADGKKLKDSEMHSDHRGEFAIRVPAGGADYVIRAEFKVGKKRLTAESKVHVNNDERVDVGLHLTE